jgi:hypothetical protein
MLFIIFVVEDEVFENYMRLLFDASEKFVLIYSSNTTDNKNESRHLKHRKFMEWIEENQNNNFFLLEHIPNKFPYDGNGFNSSISDFYIFKKIV